MLFLSYLGHNSTFYLTVFLRLLKNVVRVALVKGEDESLYIQIHGSSTHSLPKGISNQCISLYYHDSVHVETLFQSCPEKIYGPVTLKRERESGIVILETFTSNDFRVTNMRFKYLPLSADLRHPKTWPQSVLPSLVERRARRRERDSLRMFGRLVRFPQPTCKRHWVQRFV